MKSCGVSWTKLLVEEIISLVLYFLFSIKRKERSKEVVEERGFSEEGREIDTWRFAGGDGTAVGAIASDSWR